MLLETLEQDCRDWISSSKALFMNEFDMQVKLCHYLTRARRCLMGAKHYDKVYVEYVVPKDMLSTQLAKFNDPQSAQYMNEFCKEGNMMRVDIVVEKDGEFAVVELKYAPAPVVQGMNRFGEDVPSPNTLIKDNPASTDVRYSYWDDVRRIEALTRFENVVGGIALMVSNDRIYWKKPDGTPAYLPFSIHDGQGVGTQDWHWHNAPSATYPPFNVDGEYTCEWGNTQIQARAIKGGEPFRYLINKVEKIVK